jgi:hypothetical protein
MRKVAFVCVLAALAGCETIGLGPAKLPENVKVEAEAGLFAQTWGEGNVLKVVVKDQDGNLQQDARVVVDFGAGGMQPKLTDATGEALFQCDLKTVKSIKVQKTEKTRKGGT